jgi:hypothetical protein
MLTGRMGERVSTPSALGIRTEQETSPETPSLRDWTVGEASVDATRNSMDHGPWWLRANPIILDFVSVMDAGLQQGKIKPEVCIVSKFGSGFVAPAENPGAWSLR